ncbi:MAG: hypothetical protein LC789_05970 [Actinobacteria bacterium]|nr:hypothetical protein [Actinomycetota bacterium]MCA1719948.1 hypothetical protein [Actinomycetota bacterium]
MQLVVLSARVPMLAGTLRHVRAHLPWLDRVLVVTPERLRAGVAALGVDVVTDEELLGGAGPADHSHRNYVLRAALASCAQVDDAFLAADDDNRPLVDLPVETFVRNGRYRRYAFGHLDDWEQRATSYDACLLASRGVLGLHGMPRLAYASHMPQVVDKALLAEVTALFAVAAERHALDEWATYFNAAPFLHPDRFEEPEAYVTLGWPDDTSTWQPMRDPGALLFENCFLEHYAPGGVFDGIDPDDTSYPAAVDKVVRWRTYELEVLAGERPAALAAHPEPGKVGAALRRARAAAVGDPVLRDRRQRAATAAALRAQARQP